MISFTPELLERRPRITKYDIGVPPEINFPDFPAHEMLRIGANLDAEKAATYPKREAGASLFSLESSNSRFNL